MDVFNRYWLISDGFRAKLIVLKDFLTKNGIESKSIPFLSTCYGKHKAAFFQYFKFNCRVCKCYEPAAGDFF